MSSNVPTRILAGVTVPDTPLVTAAVAFAREHLSDMAFNHVMRSFLFGFCIASKDPDLSTRDLEAHAISAILHDQGWAGKTAPFITKTKRFEVDGADAAREFLRREAPGWDKHRLQLVWDAIALHTTVSICLYKEVEVAACHIGIGADFRGPDHSQGKLTWEEFDAIIKEFPRLKFADGVTEILCSFCRDKPETTYDNFMASYGERYVEGYSLEGKMLIDGMPYTREVLDTRST
ncbi:hypothetical protein MMC10_006947 [Thelotrema lepadinum]|nr:hypothetical protein [Thelotrema lepadinum]